MPSASVERMLVEKLGAVVETKAAGRKGQRDHTRYRILIDGRVIARTHISHGSGYKSLGDGLVSSMAKQLLITTKLFVEMASCTKNRDDYVAALQQQGHLPPT